MQCCFLGKSLSYIFLQFFFVKFKFKFIKLMMKNHIKHYFVLNIFNMYVKSLVSTYFTHTVILYKRQSCNCMMRVSLLMYVHDGSRVLPYHVLVCVYMVLGIVCTCIIWSLILTTACPSMFFWSLHVVLFILWRTRFYASALQV
jgi:hypothetical protein